MTIKSLFAMSNDRNFLANMPSHQIWNMLASPNSPSRYRSFSEQADRKINLCYLSVLFAFVLGLSIGIFIPIFYYTKNLTSFNNKTLHIHSRPVLSNLSELNAQLLKNIFINNSFSMLNDSSVKFIQTPLTTTPGSLSVSSDQTSAGIISDSIYWGEQIERSLPAGFTTESVRKWDNYVNSNNMITVVNIETGCGRMQNRLVTFNDGQQACVRYRQNTDQIQGELFSFYLAQILNLTNLVPSTISVIDLENQLWSTVKNQIQLNVQWHTNRPVVLTKFIKNLDTAFIPNIFKSINEQRHLLNKNDILGIVSDSKKFSKNLENYFVELAQWSDLIIFDYLTANLDRIVNNLYNYQWNINIMDAPAHNLAKEVDSNLLIFLDNESGLLHGYRLLKKYEIYHTLLLDNLCLFRRGTVDILRQLFRQKNVGQLLKDKFNSENSDRVKEILPTLPEKSIKILNERIARVYRQIETCEQKFSD